MMITGAVEDGPKEVSLTPFSNNICLENWNLRKVSNFKF